jgi:hypothetical protein
LISSIQYEFKYIIISINTLKDTKINYKPPPDKPYIHLKRIGGILSKLLLIPVALLAATIITLIIYTTISNNTKDDLSAAAQGTTEDPTKLSAQLIQAQEDIRKELIDQGQIIVNQIKELFGLQYVESNLTQAYQTSFTGDLPSAVTQLQLAGDTLDSSINSLLSSGQELVSVSQNKSIILNNNTRMILSDFGESLANLSVAAQDIRLRLQQTN